MKNEIKIKGEIYKLLLELHTKPEDANLVDTTDKIYNLFKKV